MTNRFAEDSRSLLTRRGRRPVRGFKNVVISDLFRGQRLVLRIRDEGGIDPQFRITTADEGDLAVAMTLSPNLRERADQMHMLKLFMAWKSAHAFVMTAELHNPDALLSVGVSHKETLAVMCEICRDPLGFGQGKWLGPDAVGNDVLSLLPRGAMSINKSQIEEINRFFGPTGLFPAVEIGE
jgi:hypothetical protein